MSNDVLMIYAAHGVHEAHREVLCREVMNVDGVNWEAAQGIVQEMEVRFQRPERKPHS
jgi:hypothetical protein